jgi:hypothetical protein
MSKVSTRRRPQPAPQSFYTRRITLRPNSFDPATGTFEAVVATETPVTRAGGVIEILRVTPATVRMERLKSGRAPLVDSHRIDTANAQIGVIESARIADGELIVKARLALRDDTNNIAADLAAGIPRNLSIGYRVHDATESVDAEGRTIITVTDFEPHEVSFVTVPADPATYIRNLKGRSMRKRKQPKQNDIVDDLDDDTNDLNVRHESDDDNRRTRTMSDADIREAENLAERYGLPDDLLQRQIDAGCTLSDFRAIALNRAAQRASATNINPRHSGEENPTLDDPDFLGRAIEGALYARMSGSKPEGAAVELMGRSMLDMGAMMMQARGERAPWSNRNKLASAILSRDIGGMHTTSDFPTLLTGAGTRVLLDAYKAAESPLKQLARRRDAVDFRSIAMVKLSEPARLLKVREGEEIKYGSRAESKEGFKVETYSRIFSISRQAIINDDLGAFADTSQAWGRSAASTEAELLVSLFTDNSGDGINLDDGSPLYSTARGNKAAAAVDPSVVSFDAMRLAMRTQKDDSQNLISVSPRHIVVGPLQETNSEKILAAIASAKTDDVNPFTNKLTLHVEPRFTDKSWRVFADKTELATIVLAYLNGQEGPILETRDGWTTLGMEYRAVLDVGVGIQDFRGTYLNPGE